jgi:formate dehydrogenase subunit delta
MDATALTRMANDIARNLAAQGQEQAVRAMAQHIRDFWDPRMKAAIASLDPAALLPIAAAALTAVAVDG